MPSCVFIKTCWRLSKAYCIPRKLCHFQSSGIFKLQKNGWHYEKTNVIFRLSAPKNIKKHQKIKMKKQDQKFVAQWFEYPFGSVSLNVQFTTNAMCTKAYTKGCGANKRGVGRHPKKLTVSKQLQTCAKRGEGVGTPFPCAPVPLHPRLHP